MSSFPPPEQVAYAQDRRLSLDSLPAPCIYVSRDGTNVVIFKTYGSMLDVRSNQSVVDSPITW